MDQELERFARSFGPVADSYDRGRPGYPRDAVEWLVGTEPAMILELGAGTGKLTAELAALGHIVHATDPDPSMLSVLQARDLGVHATVGSAEAIDLPARSVDVVVAAQSFHWFDHERALPEIARVLRPGGRLSLVWNLRDDRIPWVRRLGQLIDSLETPAGEPLMASDLFGFVEEKTFKHWQDVNRESIVDLVQSRSRIAVLDEGERRQVLGQVLSFYDQYGRGMDGMQLPYLTHCFRSKVVAPTHDVHPPSAEPAAPLVHSGPLTVVDVPASTDGPDDSILLIDFR